MRPLRSPLDDPPPSLQDEPLSPYERQVKNHWLENRPALAKELQAKGQLDLQVRKAVWRTAQAEVEATSQGMSPLDAQELLAQDWEYPAPPEKPNLRPRGARPLSTSASPALKM